MTDTTLFDVDQKQTPPPTRKAPAYQRTPRPTRTESKPLGERVRGVYNDARNTLTETQLADLMALEQKRRDQLIRFKAQLFDTHWEDMPQDVRDSFTARWEKMKSFMMEFEVTRKVVAKNRMEPAEWRCQRCQTLILVAWETNEHCWRCMDDPSWREAFDELGIKGWFKRHSALLDKDVIITADDSIEVPKQDGANIIQFTIEEWRLMSHEKDKTAIRQIADIKHEFAGRVI